MNFHQQLTTPRVVANVICLVGMIVCDGIGLLFVHDALVAECFFAAAMGIGIGWTVHTTASMWEKR